MNSPKVECHDISGTYRASNGGQLLPFFLFGIPDTTSPEWMNLVKINERILAATDGATVTTTSHGSDRIEVIVSINGSPLAKQVLKRSHPAENASAWFEQPEQSFRCVPEGIVLAGAYIHDWDQYRLPDDEKKRRYRRPGENHVGTSRGYFYFSKAGDGSLVMRQQLYFCLGCNGLNEQWRRWLPAQNTLAK